MKTLEKMVASYCPIIDNSCVGEVCMACENVYTKPEDKEVFSHFECLNPECKKVFSSVTYCTSCGAGRIGEKYDVKIIHALQSAKREESLYICNHFDSESAKEKRNRLLSSPYYGADIKDIVPGEEKND